MKAASHLAALERVRTLLARHAGVETATPEVSGGPANGAESEPAAETGNNPLAHLCRLFHLSPFERDILLLTAGAELDATFAPLCAKAQSDPRHDHPTFGLALAALPGADWRAFLPDAPLRHWQLVRLAPGSHLMTGELRIDERILHFLLGHDSRDEGLAGRVEPVPPPETAPVPSQARLAERLAATWKRTLGTADFPVLELSGGDTADVRALAVAIADRLGWTLQSTAAEDLPTDPADLEAFVRRWHREAMLRHGALLVEAHDLRPDAPQQVALRRFVNLTRTALLVARPRRGAGGGFSARKRPVLRVDVEKPGHEEQQDLWRALLPPGAVTLAESLAEQFDLGSAQIRGSYFAALGDLGETEGDAIDGRRLEAALWQVCRAHVRPSLAELAERIEPRATFEDLVLPPNETRTLRELIAHLRQRGRVYGAWGFGEKSTRGLGVTALFAGASGTGKTMAAEVLAQTLELDLYRIDLASIISKYIGETEKNLSQVFDSAEAGGAILLFDEADALFGKRSEVKDSHDRHANIEVSFLLQRMESYRGLAILTTNLRDALDTAFRRRLRFIVDFPFPDRDRRREIWARVFPGSTPTRDLHLDRLARLNLTGGHIKNIALHAAFLAADADKPVTMRELLIATRRELAKLDRPLAEAETRDWLT